MIYKIEFDPSVGAWMVKLQRFWFFWVPTCENKKPRLFANYAEAEKWVKEVGLDNVYRNWAERPDLYGPQYR